MMSDFCWPTTAEWEACPGALSIHLHHSTEGEFPCPTFCLWVGLREHPLPSLYWDFCELNLYRQTIKGKKKNSFQSHLARQKHMLEKELPKKETPEGPLGSKRPSRVSSPHARSCRLTTALQMENCILTLPSRWWSRGKVILQTLTLRSELSCDWLS